mgnify:CR=1 FL=1
MAPAPNSAAARRRGLSRPGSLRPPLARGCHQLIRGGPKLFESADEIIAGLAPLAPSLGADLRARLEPPSDSPPVRPASSRESDPDYARLFAVLGYDALGIDQLAQRSGLAVAALSSMLLMLELEGEVVTSRGGAYARRVGAVE